MLARERRLAGFRCFPVFPVVPSKSMVALEAGPRMGRLLSRSQR